MYFALSSETRVLLGLLLTSNILSCIAAPADPDVTITIGPPHPTPTIPISCSIGHKPPSCFTFTTTTTKSKCPPPEVIFCPSGPRACPQIVKVTTLEVPCSTDCCPITPTHTITNPCPGCITTCVIPTVTITTTTGCKSTATLPSKTLW